MFMFTHVHVLLLMLASSNTSQACFSYADHSVSAHGHQLSVFQGEWLNQPCVAVAAALAADLRLDVGAVPEQQVSPNRAGHNLRGDQREFPVSSL